jgi:hypothetical protein
MRGLESLNIKCKFRKTIKLLFAESDATYKPLLPTDINEPPKIVNGLEKHYSLLLLIFFKKI